MIRITDKWNNIYEIRSKGFDFPEPRIKYYIYQIIDKEAVLIKEANKIETALGWLSRKHLIHGI